MKVIPSDLLREFLDSTAVSGSNKNVKLKNLVMIDGSILFLCWLSKCGKQKKELIGMRTVEYFEPVKAAVLNLTVIFKNHRGQKNLDSFNKVTSCV